VAIAPHLGFWNAEGSFCRRKASSNSLGQCIEVFAQFIAQVPRFF